jgi:EpsI family protein
LPTPHVVEGLYLKGTDEVQLFAVVFPRQSQGVEAINNANRIAADLTRSIGLGRKRIDLGNKDEVQANRSRVVIEVGGTTQEHLVWQWYRVAGRSLTNRYEGKAWEALARIYPGRSDGVWWAVTTPIDGPDLTAAEERLAEFVQVAVPAVNADVDEALGISD